MKKRPSLPGLILLVAALLAPTAQPAETETEATPRSLVVLVNLAESYHADYLAEQSDFQVEAEKETIAFSSLLPQVSTRWSQDVAGSSPWQLDLTATQNLFNAPVLAQWKAAKEEVELARLNLQESLYNLRRDVLLAWINVQLSADILELGRARIKTLHEQANRAQLIADIGRGTNIDVLAARAGLASARSDLAQTKHNTVTAQDAFIRFTGEPAELLRLSATAGDFPAPLSLAEWQQRVEENNSSIAIARQQINFLQKSLDVAAATIFPRVALSAGAAARNSFSNRGEQLELSISQSLFTGGNVTAQKRQLVAQLQSGYQRFTALSRTLQQEVRRLHGQQTTNRIRIEALQEAATAAATVLENVIIGYNSEVRIAEEVLSAEEDLFEARRQLQQALYDYLGNWINLQTLASQNDEAFIRQIEGFFVALTPATEEQ